MEGAFSMIKVPASPKKQASVCGFQSFPNKRWKEGFPGGTVVENLPANAGNTGSSPGLGRSHMPLSN